MKEIWVRLKEWNRDVVTESIETGVDALVVPEDMVENVRALGRIAVAAEKGGDISVPDDIEFITILNKDDENRAGSLLKEKKVAVHTTDWDIIPVENLIPRGGDTLFSVVETLDQITLAVGIMEKGVAGVVLDNPDPAIISDAVNIVKDVDRESLTLSELTIMKVENIGIGDRVCVDTCSTLGAGEGLLVGNTSSAMFLVHAENIENPYVAPRPFRVNAGAVHAYVRVPGNRTRYLGELSAGDPVLVTAHDGSTYTAYTGRVKIEKRPMLLVEATDDEGTVYTSILQNAETIRLVKPDGSPISVVKLQSGDHILAYLEKGGRHFGMAVDESITEQ